MNIVKTTHDLEHFINNLTVSNYVTVDTEFIRETTYWPQLCLIQIASPETMGVIDPLSPEIDLTAFFRLMADPKVVKVFHAARQDIEIIYHLSGIIPYPLFDTQVAATVCGYGESISYDQIVARITGVQLDKTSRFTNWAQRPLTENQLNYALADVTYLRDVYVKLSQQLKKTKRDHWLNEEIATLSSPATYEIPLDEAWKRVKGRVRKPIELAILQNIAAWRESEARLNDVPRGRIVKDDTLIEIATQKPKDVNALSRLRSIPKGWERSAFANGLLEAVNAAMQIPKEDLPKIDKNRALPEGAAAAIDLLKVLLKLVSEENGVASKIVANADDIEKIVLNRHKSNVPAMTGWRYEIFGKKAESLLNGEVGFKFQDNRLILCEM